MGWPGPCVWSLHRRDPLQDVGHDSAPGQPRFAPPFPPPRFAPPRGFSWQIWMHLFFITSVLGHLFFHLRSIVLFVCGQPVLVIVAAVLVRLYCFQLVLFCMVGRVLRQLVSCIHVCQDSRSDGAWGCPGASSFCFSWGQCLFISGPPLPQAPLAQSQNHGPVRLWVGVFLPPP